MTLLSQFHFKGNQEKAVTDSAPAIAVTAGAGSGKTLSLVGRYLHLLEQGYPIRSILAITFTEKAACEMRSRIRNSLSSVHPSSFILHPSNLDSARIGTIHSLCAEILRSHPSEAGLDPAFEVLEEGLSAALQAEAIESALAWAAADDQSAALFGMFKENELRQILNALMSRRLDVTAESALADFHALDFSPTELVERFATSLSSYLATHLDSATWIDSLSTLSSHKSSSPEDKLELARQTVLAHWTEIQQARAAKNWDDVLASLATLRKAISTQGQKANWDDIETIRESMRQIKDIYEEHLKFLAEKSRFALDEQLAAYLPAVHRLFDQTLLEYQSRKDEREGLDFDDLEGLTAKLLTAHPELREQIQSELRAVLVDEFQDTNNRQRQIVYALTGFNSQSGLDTPQRARARLLDHQNRKSEIVNLKSPDLFIVGDSKQSIYRFRSADVTVFRQVQADIKSSGGELIDLDLTFRAHKPLLEQLNSLLAPILGETDDPVRPYAVPFAPLRAYRQTPVRENIQPPFIEFHLGMGESAEEGRTAAAQSLANRLRELHETEGFDWGDMALLFRSSTAFPIYENALEAANIPFVTVAGRGFYDRPEIRDLLNILAAIADPTDDLALVGALRSPAFAIPDSEIYKLRYPNNTTTPAKIFESLKQSTQVNTETGIHPLSFILYPYATLTELHALSSRAPAAAILKRLLDLTHYRAILSSNPNGARMIRNVEKLLADAHRSRLVSLTDFLAYVQTLRDVGLREGEAPADSSNAGAVQLMTVHKAKGLEFPLTVLADAAHQPHAHTDKVQLADTLLLNLRDDDFHSTAWQLAARLEDDRAEAEDARLLYVAATRAKEKLLISGHVKQKKDGTLSLSGWLSKFSFLEMATPEHFPINDRIYAAVYPYSQADEPAAPRPDSTPQTESPRKSDLLEPLVPASSATDEKLRARESDPPQRVWRIVSKVKTPRAPAWLVGRLVHEAIHRWRFDDLENFLKPFALESGLTDESEIHAAIQESRRMLERLRAHPLFAELDSAREARHHEVRYDLPDPYGRGIMDLLYRTAAGWFIIDFKTDDVRSDAEAQSAISQNGYDLQVERYAQAIENQLNVKAKTRLVFLNVNNRVEIFDLEENPMSKSKTVYQIKVTLIDSKPPIWRRILIADTTTLLQLHDILQIVMGWADYHLRMFTINGQIYGNPEDDEFGNMGTKNESRFKLNQLIGREGFKFRYEYDFGDSWLHDLVVEKILPAEKDTHYPVCVAGKRACPPEDSGGVGGYEEILEARANPKHPQHREYKEWIGENFDPERFNLDEVNKVLRHPRSHKEADPVINGQDYSQPLTAGEEILAKIATWVSGLDEKQFALTESLAVRRDMSTFLSYLNDNRVVGTQSTGNLPLKAVREICAQFVNPPVLDEKLGDRVYKLRSEDDVWQLFFLHMLANTGGLVTGGQALTWKVTPSGNSFLSAPAPIQLGFMLDVWWHYEDWRIAFPVSGLSEGLPSDFNKITLKRLRELPVGKSTSYESFADQLIKETRFTWPSVDQTFVNNTMRSAIERMVILPLIEFGIIKSEYEMKDIGGSKFSKLSKICLTPFGKVLLETL